MSFALANDTPLLHSSIRPTKGVQGPIEEGFIERISRDDTAYLSPRANAFARVTVSFASRVDHASFRLGLALRVGPARWWAWNWGYAAAAIMAALSVLRARLGK